VLKGTGGDLKIVRTDPLSLSFERAPDLGALCRAHIVERE